MPDERFGDFAGGPSSTLSMRPGQAGFVEQFGEAERRQGRFLGRFEDDGRARGHGGGELVRDLVERMVEGRDAAAQGEGSRTVKILRALPCGEMSHEKTWPSSRGAHGGEAQHVDGAGDLVARLADAQAGLRGDEPRKRVALRPSSARVLSRIV